MSTSKEKIEFKMLDHQRVGEEHVTFKLEDGTIVKVKVDLDRVGIATNYKNPDGTTYRIKEEEMAYKQAIKEVSNEIKDRVLNSIIFPNGCIPARISHCFFERSKHNNMIKKWVYHF